MLVLSLAAAGLAGASKLPAQEPPRAELPRAEDILDRADKVVGGKTAELKTVVVKVKMRIPDKDLEINMLVCDAGPNRYYSQVSVEGLRKSEIVISGDAAWEKDSITGARLLKGEQKAAARRSADEIAKVFRPVGNWRKEYKEARTVAEENVAGKPAYKVQLTTLKDHEMIVYFDKHSGLAVRMEKDQESPRGKVHVIESYGDYRKVGGVLIPFAGRITEGPDETILVTIEGLEYNVDIPEEHFALPAELGKLKTQR
jgi:hypothetical protein